MNEKVMTYAAAAQDIGRNIVHKGMELYENRGEMLGKAEAGLNSAKDKVTELDLFDFAVFKLAILSLGISIGAYFSKKFKKLVPLLCAFTAVSAIYLLLVMLIRDDEE